MSQVSKYEDQFQFKLQQPMFAFRFIGIGEQIINSDEKKFDVIASNLHNGSKVVEQKDISEVSCNDFQQRMNLSGFYCFQENYDLAVNNYNPGTDNYFSVDITECDETKQKEGKKCANREDVQSYMKQNYLHVILFFEQYSIENRRFETVSKQFYLSTKGEQKQYHYSVELSEFSVDENMLLQNFQDKSVISGVSLAIEEFDVQSTKIMFQIEKDSYIRFIFSLDPKTTQVRIQYKKLSFLIAEFSGVFNILLILGLIASYYSEQMMFKEIVYIILQRYFPRANQSELDLLLQEQNGQFDKITILKKINIKEVFKELVELRLILSLLLTRDQQNQITQVGLSVPKRIKKKVKRNSSQKLELTKIEIPKKIWPTFGQISQKDFDINQNNSVIKFDKDINSKNVENTNNQLGINQFDNQNHTPTIVEKDLKLLGKTIDKQFYEEQEVQESYLNNIFFNNKSQSSDENTFDRKFRNLSKTFNLRFKKSIL